MKDLPKVSVSVNSGAFWRVSVDDVEVYQHVTEPRDFDSMNDLIGDALCVAFKAGTVVGLYGSKTRRAIYVASKSKHGDMWRRYRDEDGVPIISTWIDESEEGQTSSWSDLYQRVIREVAISTAFVLYAPDGDISKGGAFLELGAALASEVPVFAYAPAVEPKILAHPLITICENLEQALERAMS